MDIFNNREIAIGTWLAVLLLFCLVNPKVRDSFFSVLRCSLQRVIITSLGLMTLYVTLVVYGLSELGIWSTDQLKNTIIWAVVFGIASFFRINQISENPGHYFSSVIRDTFRLVVVLEFVIAFYIFPLWVELIVLPLFTLISIMVVIAGREEEYEPNKKLLNSILMLGGISVTSYAIYNLAVNFDVFARRSTLTDFSLPPILSLLYLPFLFILTLYINYQSAFVKLQFSIKDSALRGYAKRQALLNFHFKTELLRRWVRNLMWIRPENKESVKQAVQDVQESRKREKNPKEVALELGWSPEKSCKFLIEEGLSTSDYHRVSDDVWQAEPVYLDLDEGILPSRLAYYVAGIKGVATQLRLNLMVNTPDSAQEAKHTFCDVAGKLFRCALQKKMPEVMQEKILDEIDSSTVFLEKELLVSIERWPGHHKDGYELKFIIQNKE